MRIEEFKDAIYTCNRTRCGICVKDCPEYKEMTLEPGASRGKMIALRGILENKYQVSSRLAEIFYKCFLCGYCSARCALDNHKIFESFRADLVEHGMAPEVLKQAVDFVVKRENPYGTQREDKASWAEDLNLPKRSTTLLFAGCTEGLVLPDIARTTAILLQDSRLQFGYMGEEEPCCGLALHEWGFVQEFEEKATSTARSLKQTGANEVITTCPYCTYAFNNVYPEIVQGFEITATHMIPALLRLIDDGKISLKNRVNMKVTYHDPCHLARYQKIVDEPRAILQRIPGVELVEMAHNKLLANCCGGGGSVRAIDSDFAFSVARKRLAEVEDTQAEALVTSCPFCLRMLSTAARSSDSNIRVLDLTELVMMSKA